MRSPNTFAGGRVCESMSRTKAEEGNTKFHRCYVFSAQAARASRNPFGAGLYPPPRFEYVFLRADPGRENFRVNRYNRSKQVPSSGSNA